MVQDEPDISSRPGSTSTEIAAAVDAIRVYDPTHPTFLTLAMGRRFPEYGAIPDITGMDHYVQCWPNVQTGSNELFCAKMREALDYGDMLKNNTEPLPMRVWSQLGSLSSECQPTAWGMSTQFWLSVMGGADGMKWFIWDHLALGDPGSAAAYAQAALDARVARQVRDALSFGEVESSSVSSNHAITTRTIVGEARQVVLACNMNFQTIGLPWLGGWVNHPSTGTITVDAPDWIDPASVLRVTPSGAVATPHSTSGQTVTLSVAVNDECAVFTIGEPDTVPPDVPTGVNRAAADTLAWVAGHDDVGVTGDLGVTRCGRGRPSQPTASRVTSARRCCAPAQPLRTTPQRRCR